MTEWAAKKNDRFQRSLMGPSLDEQIGEGHGVRLLDQLLQAQDWSAWEAKYARKGAGRPPVHPRLMAGAILYGLLRKIRSTRDLEDATRMRLDFMWLLEGRTIDHTTFCVFRQRFEEQIGQLFRDLNRHAAKLRKATLAEILIDGTHLRADSDRYGARTAEALEQRLSALEEQIVSALSVLQEESPATPESLSPEALSRQLEQLEAQKQKMERALEVARDRDQHKRKRDGRKITPVRVPVTDPESTLLPNKDGGYAPNYTPVAAVDTDTGLIVGAEVASGQAETECVAPVVEQVSELKGDSPQRVVFDSGFPTGPVLENLHGQGIEAYAPMGTRAEDNPAKRPDPRVPVPEELRGNLPIRGKKFDRSAFVYDKQTDCYYCPMGHRLQHNRTCQRPSSSSPEFSVKQYECKACSACPLADQCKKESAKGRTITRDDYEPLREDVAHRMQTEPAKRIYRRRAPIAEGAFAQIKTNLGIRRFSRRGMAKVKADWLWICTAHNLMKLITQRRKDADDPKNGAAGMESYAHSPIIRLRSSIFVWLTHRLAPGLLAA